MTLLQISLAIEIQRTGSLSAAAQNLGISQPNASSSLKRLEEELECRLFTRGETGMVPTEQGALFLEHAKKIIHEEKAMRMVCKMKKTARLRVGITNYFAAEDAFTDFCAENKDAPLADFTCVNVSFENAIKLLKGRSLDIAVCFVLNPGIERETAICQSEGIMLNVLRQIPVHLRFRKGHPMAELLREDFSAENLKMMNQYPFVVYCDMDKLIDKYNDLSPHIFGFSYKILVSSQEMRHRIVGSTDAYSLGLYLPESRCNQYNIESVAVGSQKAYVVSLVRTDSVITEDMTRYLEILDEKLKNAIEE